VADSGYPGMVLRYAGEESSLEVRGDHTLLRAESRASLARAARHTAGAGWAGLEWAEGIPGTLGGAVTGNAGAYGGEIAAVLESVTVLSLDGGLERFAAADCGFDYRKSRFQPAAGPVLVSTQFIVEAELRLRAEDPARLADRLQDISRRRRANTPAGLSCGSVFRNPPGIPPAG